MTGLILGALGAGLAGRQLLEGNAVMVAIVIGGIVGLAIGWVTYRLWMAVLLAAMLGLAVPWGVLAWHGAPPSPIEQRIESMRDGNDVRNQVRELADAQSFTGGLGEAGDDRLDNGNEPGVFDRAGEAAGNLWGELRAWWVEDVDAGVRWTAMTAAAVVTVTGFVIGLILPELAASLATSLVGAALVMAAVVRLSGRYVGAVEQWIPAGPRGLLIGMGAMVVVGTLVQWTILRKRGES
jgi:hypothetical protein